jgi:hypothetical protein
MNSEGAEVGELWFNIEQAADGYMAELKEVVPDSAAQRSVNFESRWRPILEMLDTLMTVGDHLTSFRSILTQSLHGTC